VSVDYNAVAEALLALLGDTYPFVVKSRRLRDPERLGLSETPALFLLEHEEEYERASPSMPPKRTLWFVAMVYVDVGDDENAIPVAIINDVLGAFNAALGTENYGHGRLTLGDLAYAAMISGTAAWSSGELTGKAALSVPIAVLLP
jgi:hypothetical protein